MSQSRKHSLFEVFVSTLFGYGIALLTQLWVFPLYGIPLHLWANAQIALIFTFISIIRSYIFRRLFNHLTFGRIR